MDESAVYCTYHPTRPTPLRCNRCNKPICSSCAVRTPVGYRCKDCVREQQKVFETAFWYDFVVAFFVSAVLFGLVSILSWWIGIFILLAAAFVGYLAVRAVNWAVRHRRSRFLWLAAAAGGIVGCLPIITVQALLLVFNLLGGGGLLDTGLGLVWSGAYMVVAVGSLIANMKGIRF